MRGANVNFATGKATVEYDPQATGRPRGLMGTVKDTGYGTAGTKEAEFLLDDSARPAGSAQPLEHYLRGRRGVVSASFNLARMTVEVEYLAGMTDARALRRAVEDFGYRVREIPDGGAGEGAQDTEQAARKAEYTDLLRKFLVAAACRCRCS